MSKSYHFSLGDSSVGPVGFCARVDAASEKEAVERLREMLPDEVEVDIGLSTSQYVTVYLNPSAISEDDIDEVDDE